MRSRFSGMVVLVVMCITVVLGVVATQTASLTLWSLPYQSAFPAGLSLDAHGGIYTVASGEQEVYRLDPGTDTFRSWGVGERPQDVLVANGTVFCTVREANQLVYFDPAGLGVTTAALPFPNVGPSEIHRGPDRSDGRIVFWIAEWNAPGVLRFEYDPSDAPWIVGDPLDRGVGVERMSIHPVTVDADYELFPYDITLMPEPEPLVASRAASSFMEWTIPLGEDFFLQDIAVATDGKVWISFGTPFLYRLDPAAATIQLMETIRNVTIFQGLLAADDGSIWFGNLVEGGIGHFDPVTGRSETWRIPGTGEVYDLAFDSEGAVWYTDRIGDCIGRLDIRRNEATVYRLPDNSEPLNLAVDVDGAIWFAAGSGNFIGRLEASR